MQIAVSGTHFIGKSTLIEDFVEKHSNYSYEMEPYYQLQNQGIEEFSEELTLECALRQLDYSIELLNSKKKLDNIIFDRCPIDFIAYAMYIADRRQINLTDTVFSERFPEIKASLIEFNCFCTDYKRASY
ncbi:MAG: AAA family ATPase [Proteobacteria bacterium]|nr:AAA family ATPase [Pseudomonadota bacterium]